MKKQPNSELRELAGAMNRLADSLSQTNTLIAEACHEDPNWVKLPTMLMELNPNYGYLPAASERLTPHKN